MMSTTCADVYAFLWPTSVTIQSVKECACTETDLMVARDVNNGKSREAILDVGISSLELLRF